MPLTYCATQVYNADRDRFFLSMFVPEPHREALTALYALHVEMEHIHEHVREEMIGHIRYAWWQEKIDALYEGSLTHGHPVLESLEPLAKSGALPRADIALLIEHFRGHYPQLPPDSDKMLDDMALALIRKIHPPSEKPWQKAHTIIANHRRRYGRSYTSWMLLRLLLAGFAFPRLTFSQKNQLQK